MKYNLVGIVNTLLGFTIIFGLMYLGVSATISNLIGYTIGAFISYRLNSRYTFTTHAKHKAVMIKFFMVLGIAYILNFIVLQWLLLFINPYIAQLGAAMVYTVSSFIMAKYFAFKEAK
jgi:putative flippase GtrA